MIYSGKSAVVLGFGHSGEAAATLLAEEGSRVTVCESADTPELRARVSSLEALGVKVLFGAEAEQDPRRYDVCVLSPGIDPAVPLVRNVLAKNIPVIGELELAFNECLCPVMAITGTNGKTTTTELLTAMLDRCGIRVMSSGNIGLPFATAVRHSDALDVMVLEVSSFQLETIRAFRPAIAAWLNLSPNHLDRYPGIEEYRAAKLRIFENQTPEDFAVVNALADLPPLAAKTITFSARTDGADFTLRGTEIFHEGRCVLDQRDTRMPGLHNAENLMAALAMGVVYGVDVSRLAAAAGDYSPPVHRCEFVRELEGVLWINDSKATNLDSVEMAIRSQDRPIILIAGGKDKGFDFDPLLPLIKERVTHAVLIGEMRERIRASWPGVSTQTARSLSEAVELARAAASPGDAILFSPGTSSFDMFRNYGERGNQFKNLVHSLSSPSSRNHPNTH